MHRSTPVSNGDDSILLEQRQRRLCWLIMMCLALPPDNPKRRQREPEFLHRLVTVDLGIREFST
jgi:hypothetical protein